jgi:hypothetical protein
VAKRRLQGVTKVRTRDKTNYILRPGARIDGPVQAWLETSIGAGRMYAGLSMPPGSPSEARPLGLAALVTDAAGDACAAGVPRMEIRQKSADTKKDRARNRAGFIKLTKALERLGDGKCETHEGGAQGAPCIAWSMKTADADGGCAHSIPADAARDLKPAPKLAPKAKAKAKAAKPKRPVKNSPITIAKEKREFTEALKKANDSKGKRCKVLAREKGYTISECGAGFTFKASNAKGKEIGRLDLTATGGNEYKVSWSGTHESTRGERVGTALYEAAAEATCKRGNVLTSDTTRSRYSEKFWAKQAAKGRATCQEGEGGSDSMSREQAYEEVYENYLSEAESEYIESNNYEEEATDAYFESNDHALTSAKEEHVSNNDLRWETYEAYFEANEDARTEAVGEYLDNHEDDFDISDDEGGGGGSYYGPPWHDTVASFNRRISEAPTFEAKEKLREELQQLDKKLPEQPDDDEWPCRKYTLDASMCQKQEIDLGKLPAGHTQRKANKCPPGYRKHKAKNGMVSCKPVRRRKR